MTAKRDKAPAPIVRKDSNGRLTAVAAYDAEMLGDDPIGAEYDLVRRNKRTLPLLRTYWMALHRVVKATDRWPTAEHLHDELKLICGFRRQVVDMETGEIAVVVDSIAFEAMDQAEFKNFFDRATDKLSDAVGYDVVAFLGEVRRAA